MFGAQSSSSLFGTPSSTPLFGASSSTPAFGTPSSTPAFGAPSSTPAFGAPSSTPAFGAQSSTPFGTPSSTPAFGTPSSTPAFGTPSSTPFGTPSSTPAFGTPSSTPSFGMGFGASLFSTPFSAQTQQQQQTSLFQPQQANAFQTSSFGSPFPNAQLTTLMAPVAPLPFSLADRDIQAIVDAYKEEPTNHKYAFKHLLFSVTEQQFRAKPAGVSDIMWAEAMSKLEGMESTNRERLWPQLVHGFKDLSQRLKLQDEAINSDAERSRMTQSNVKLLQRHCQAELLPWTDKLTQKEKNLQRRLLRTMRIVEALEGKGCRLPLTIGEAELAEKLAAITRELKGSGEVSRRVQLLLSLCRLRASGVGAAGSLYLPGSTKILEQSLVDMQDVLQQETDAIGRLANVMKRDVRDMEIIMAEDTDMSDAANLGG